MSLVVMDSICHQAIRHQGTESAHYPNSTHAGDCQDISLSGFIRLLEENDYNFSFVDISQDQLADADLLIIASRSNRLMYSQDELDNISSYYDQNGSIFLMANHRGLVAPQNQVCSELNFPNVFNEQTILNDEQNLIINESHPISRNCDQGLQIRTSCTMNFPVNPNSEILVRNQDQSIGIFACAHQDENDQSKRIVFITSSGHISSQDDSGSNLLSQASNRTWTLNALNWLTDNLEQKGKIT